MDCAPVFIEITIHPIEKNRDHKRICLIYRRCECQVKKSPNCEDRIAPGQFDSNTFGFKILHKLWKQNVFYVKHFQRNFSILH